MRLYFELYAFSPSGPRRIAQNWPETEDRERPRISPILESDLPSLRSRIAIDFSSSVQGLLLIPTPLLIQPKQQGRRQHPREKPSGEDVVGNGFDCSKHRSPPTVQVRASDRNKSVGCLGGLQVWQRLASSPPLLDFRRDPQS